MAAPNILCDTAGMTNERWLECRMHGPKGNIPYTVGGSDVATIFGVSPWVTPLELWLVKKGKIKPPAKMNPKTLEMGHLLEPIAAHFYGVKTGNTVIEDTNMYHEHGVLETTADKILIDFVTKPSVRTDTKKLKKDFPSVYAAVTNTSESRRLKVSVQPL